MNELTADGEGEAVVENKNMAQARDRALEDAFQKAFEKAVYALLPSPLPIDRTHEGIQRLLPKHKRYLIGYRILSEIPTPQIYFVSVQAIYSVPLLKGDLSTIGFMETVKQPPVRDIIINVHNVFSCSCYHELSDGLLKNIPGVISLLPKMIYGTEVTLSVRFRGDPRTLVEAIQNWKRDDFSIGSVTNSSEAVEIQIVSP
jgi:hypothetical protein